MFVWKRLIRGSGKPGKLREFNFVKFVSTLYELKSDSSILSYLYCIRLVYITVSDVVMLTDSKT